MKKNELIPMFNKFASSNKSVIQKALSSAAGVGESLSPQHLEQNITDTIIRMTPELQLLRPRKISSKKYEFNRITAKPGRGGAMGENATTNRSNSRYQDADVKLKIIRRKGRITNFLQDVSEEYIDIASVELEQQLQAHVLDLIFYLLYGNKDVKTFVGGSEEQIPNVEFNGIETFAATHRYNQSQGGKAFDKIRTLSNMIDQSTRKGSKSHRLVFSMSPEMLTTVSDLLDNVWINQGLFGKLTQVEIGGGWRLNHFRDIPIIETTATKAVEQTDVGTITATGVATGGSLTDGTYYYRIAAITVQGEQGATEEGSVTLSGGTSTQRIRFNFANVHQTDGVDSAMQYKLYLSTTALSTTLKKIVSAFVYDADLSRIDGTAGDNGLGTNYIYIGSMTADSSVPVHMQADVPLVASGGIFPESIILWDLDEIQGLGNFRYTNTGGSEFGGLVTVEQMAKYDDYIEMMVKSYCALADNFEATTVWERGWRVA